VGVELGGAVKNVIAIGAGISEGLGFGSNSRAALITRGLLEISRLAVKKGASPLTLSGLSGMGDLVLTCTGDLSRNRQVGLDLGRGKKLDDIVGGMTMVAEGVKNARSVHDLAQKLKVEMPICEGVYRVLYEGLPVREGVAQLMARDPKPELG
jgi:glycerol-3-phosphate dehydrogenase (NAD(P)+)